MLSNLLWWPWAQIGGGGPPTPATLPPGLGGVTEGLPPVRGRRRIYQDVVTDEEDVLTIILMTLDE